MALQRNTTKNEKTRPGKKRQRRYVAKNGSGKKQVARILKDGLRKHDLPDGALLPSNLSLIWVLQQPMSATSETAKVEVLCCSRVCASFFPRGIATVFSSCGRQHVSFHRFVSLVVTLVFILFLFFVCVCCFPSFFLFYL